MSSITQKKMLGYKKELESDCSGGSSISLNVAETNRIVWRKMLRSLHQDVNRADELVKLIKRLHSSNNTKKLLYSPPAIMVHLMLH